MPSQTSVAFRLLDVFSAIFITVLLTSMIMAQKIFTIFGVPFTTAIMVFPVSYIIGDVLTEVYGYAQTRRVIWLGFFSSALMTLFLAIGVYLPPAASWPNQEAFALILHNVPRTVFASLLAYLCGEFANSFVMAKMKIWTRGRFLWSRTIGSTIVGQGVDTAVFVVIAFYGVMPTPTIINVIVSAYLFKVAYEAAATPLTYMIVRIVKKIENIDVFDTHTNFTPFRFLRSD